MKQKTVGPNAPETAPVATVGVGASAGGLEAFSILLKHLPQDTGMALVLVQHLDPQHESVLASLLARTTTMPVIEATDGVRVLPNQVYVIPPNTNMFIARGLLHLQPRETGRVLHLPVNFFFESLARDEGERAIGIVLSGAATDGTLGLQAIKAEGGIAFAQDESAKYDSMPRSAVAAGCVDFVMSPENIAKELARIASHPFALHVFGGSARTKPEERNTPEATRAEVPLPTGGGGSSQTDAETARTEADAPGKPRPKDNDYKKILLLLQSYSGVDFSLYKSSTIQRRIARRVLLNKLDTLEAYADYLKDNDKELEMLYSDVLISVTSFFRNPEAFETLKTKVFPKLIGSNQSDPLRVWVLGCSTGQEAYSIAMSIVEYADTLKQSPRLQVFATDINEALLDKARRGLYAKTLELEISPERLRRFFVEEEGGYRINKTLRDSCVFAQQNLIADPPFSRMDLISCRNMLIYLDQSVQQKAIPTFHYALKPHGYLFLGSSESLGQFTELFDPVDKKFKIYARKAGPTPALNQSFPPAPPSKKHSPVESAPPATAPGFPIELSAQREADRVTLNQFAPPAVLINENLQILQFRGSTGAYLEPPTGAASFYVLKMAKKGLLAPLRAAIDEAKAENKIVLREKIRLHDNHDHEEIRIQVVPLTNLKERCYLIFFMASGAAHALNSGAPAPSLERAENAASEGDAESKRAAELERELNEIRDYAQAIEEQYAAANEELQASGEEIQSANEELQSINEELETSKEELESNNEELTTVNEELATRNDELSAANNDLNNFHISVNLPLVLVARDLTVRRFTAPAAKLFNFQSSDVGRYIGTIRHNLQLADLEDLVKEVVDSVSIREREVQDRQGRWFQLRIRPYMTFDMHIDGAVLVLIDIDELKRTQEAQRRSELRYRRLFESASDGILILDPMSNKITEINPQVVEYLGYPREELIGRELFQIGMIEDEEASRGAIQKLKQEGSIRYEDLPLKTKSGERREIEFVGRLYKEEDRESIQCSIRDVSERNRWMRANFFLAAIVESSQDSIVSIDFDMRITSWNKGAERLYGYTKDEILGKSITQLTLPQEFQEICARMSRIKGGEAFDVFEAERVHKDGSLLHLSVTLSGIKDAGGRVVGFSTIARDITAQRRATEALRFLGNASVALFTSLDQTTILNTLTRLTVPSLAEWAFVDLLHEERIERVAVACKDPSLLGVVEQFKRFEPERTRADDPAAAALFSGQTVLIKDFTEKMLAKASKDVEHEKLLRRISPKSVLAVPLVSRNRIIGALTLLACESRRFDDQDLVLVELLARRAGTALDNAILYREAEEAAKRLAYADRSKDEFLAMLAHELRNPLAPIKSAAEVLRMKGIADPVVIRAQAIIQRQANHMTRLVDDLLDTSRIQHRKVKLNKVEVDLTSTVLGVLDAVDETIRKGRHVLTTDLKRDRPLYIYADPARVAQIVTNLVVNAAKYTPSGGAIHVSTARENGMAIIKVRDNGIGIEKHMLGAIFDLFTQVEVSLERSRGGLGVGLKLVKELVEMHGGSVEARSEGKGKGSEFIVRLPEAIGSGASTPAIKNSGPVPSRRILVVDDNSDILEAMSLMLTMSGHHVEVAEDGAKGVAMAAKQQFDVALVDIGLPGMNGYEVATRIRENPATSRIVLIALTGYGQEKDKRRAHQAGFDDHLTKPVDAEVLAEVLRNLEKYRQ